MVDATCGKIDRLYFVPKNKYSDIAPYRPVFLKQFPLTAYILKIFLISLVT